MSRLTSPVFGAEEYSIDLKCFNDLESYDLFYEFLTEKQIKGLIEAINKLAQYEDLGTLEELTQLKAEHKKLKARLENCIVPKFKKDDWVYVIEPSTNKHCELDVFKVCLNNRMTDITYDYAFDGEEVTDDEGQTTYEADIGIANENQIFTTKEQAEAKLKELKKE
jgi:hypothetical protein